MHSMFGMSLMDVYTHSRGIGYIPYSGYFMPEKIFAKARYVVFGINFTKFKFTKHASSNHVSIGWSMHEC